MRLAPAVGALACAATLIGGCSSTAPVGSGSATLRADVLALSRSAAAQNWAAAGTALTRLRADLAAAVASGLVGGTQAAAIRADASTVAADLVARQHRASAPSTSTVSSPATHTMSKPAPKQPKPAPPKKHDHKHHGPGGGNDDGD